MFDLRFRGKIQLARKTHQLHIRQRQAFHFWVIIGCEIGIETKARHQVFHIPGVHRTITIGRGVETLFEHAGKGLLGIKAQFV
ncbi:hypothetical protein D3C71_1627610 [compost metagenome]